MELINIETQEKMETLVLNKLSFLNKSTFDADEQYLNKDGKDELPMELTSLHQSW